MAVLRDCRRCHVYVEREAMNETRLISARLANRAERRSYNGYYQVDNQGWSKAD
jgi:uncharacterized DUF497 family protein